MYRYQPPISADYTITRSFTWVVANPEVTSIPGPYLGSDISFIRLDAACVNGTSVSFNLEIRDTPDDASPTNILSSDLDADTNGANTTTFSSVRCAEDKWLWLDISAVTGAVTSFVVTLRYREDRC